jgi:hypothetical protein
MSPGSSGGTRERFQVCGRPRTRSPPPGVEWEGRRNAPFSGADVDRLRRVQLARERVDELDALKQRLGLFDIGDVAETLMVSPGMVHVYVRRNLLTPEGARCNAARSARFNLSKRSLFLPAIRIRLSERRSRWFGQLVFMRKPVDSRRRARVCLAVACECL